MIDDEVSALLNNLMDEHLSNELSQLIATNKECITEFKAFLYAQMHYDLSLEKFNNLLLNLEKFTNLDACLTNKLIYLLVKNYNEGHCRKYILFLKENFPIKFMSLFVSEFLQQSNIYSEQSAYRIQKLKLIAENLQISFVSLFVALSDYSYEHGYRYDYRQLINDLSLQEKYELFVLSAQNRNLFEDIDFSLGDYEFFQYISEYIYDDSEFCIAFRQYLKSDSYYHQWEFGSFEIFKLFIEFKDKIPLTIEELLQTCIDIDDAHTIVYLGKILPKKRILNILQNISYPSPALDIFYSKYEHDPEIQKLLPFI